MRRILISPLLALLLAAPSLARAAPPAPVDLMNAAEQRATAAVPARAFPGSAVEGSFNPAALSASRIRIEVNGGRQLVAVRQSETRGPRGDVTWTGEFEGSPGSLLNVTFHRGQVYGFLHHGPNVWEIESRGVGRVQLFKLDEARLPQEGTPRSRPAGDTLAATSTGAASLPATAAEPVVQDMLVVYTQQAATAALNGGTNIETRIINAVAAANSAYANSGVNIQMNLVHTALVDYTETGDMGVSLDRVRITNDGYMDGVHALRDQYGADLVALITNESNYCGIAYVNSSASSAFSVTWWNCFAGQTFAHEVGHNQGNSHDRANGSGGAYPYSYGYRTCDHPALANGQSFRTVMAYSCTGVNRVNYFSNPNVLYNGVAQMGISYELDPTRSADNARSMNNTAASKAAFRSPPGTLPAAPTSLAGTAASSTQINLTWVDNAGDETGYHIERAVGGGSYGQIATLAAGATSFANTGLIASTTYSYRVRAYNSAGFSSYSNAVTVTTQAPPPPPAAPGSPTVSLSGRTATISWTDVAGETSYQLVREVLNTKNNTWSATTTTLAANTTSRSEGLSRGKTYRYKIRAVNASGSSDYALVSCAGITSCTNTSQFRVP